MLDTNERTYQIWERMMSSCQGRGSGSDIDVTVDERWLSFEGFIQDMGTPPTPSCSLERIDLSLGYIPSNCIWSPHLKQRVIDT